MNEIEELIPQRAPFLFVDKILERSEKAIVTQKYLTGEEDFFKGHFPGNPIMPGVLLQEALFQTEALLMGAKEGPGIGLVVRVNNVKYREVVIPNTTLTIHVEHLDTVGSAYFFKGKVKVLDKTVASAEFSCVKKESL